MQVHHLGARAGRDDCSTNAAFWADGTEDVGGVSAFCVCVRCFQSHPLLDQQPYRADGLFNKLAEDFVDRCSFGLTKGA
jgi:hypothetical protein